jgi:DNA-directed RNA polymerase specialized sigma24 family protein
VDLTRQLSNPRTPLRRLPELDLHADGSPTDQPDRTKNRSPRVVQRRLRPQEVAELVAAYETGATTRELADRFGIHRNTVSTHLERADVPTRTRRGLSPGDVDEAARL